MLPESEHNKTRNNSNIRELRNRGRLILLLSENIVSILKVLSVLLFLYAALRAYFMGLTHDESFTYLEYVRKDWQIACTLRFTNNHLLNTWLMKLSCSLFGNSEFVLRLPNLIFFAIYLYYSTKLSLLLKDALFSFSGWIILNCNPFILDFFSLARGYGISMGLLMISLFYTYNWITDNGGIKNTLLVMLPIALSILANLTFINLLISFSIGLILIASVKNKSDSRYKSILLIVCIGIISCFLSFRSIFKLKGIGNFDFGGNTGLWEDTVISLVSSSLYGAFELNNIVKGIIIFFMAALAIFTIFLFIRIIFKKNDSKDIFATIIFLVLALCLTAIWLQHKLFGIPYAMDRTVLYLIPLISILYLFVLNGSTNWLIPKILVVLPTAAAIIIFILSVNLSHTFLWWYDYSSKNFIKELGKSVRINPELNSVMIGVHQLYWPSYDYYRLKYNLLYLNPAGWDDNYSNKYYQYYMLPGKDNSINLVQGTINRDYHIIKTKQLIKSAEEPEVVSGLQMLPYSTALRDTIDQRYDFVLANLTCEIRSDTPAKDASLVFSIKRNDKLIFWKNMSTHEYPVNKDNWTKASYSTFLPDSIAPGDEVSAYIYTIGKCKISIKSMELTLLD